MRRFGWNRSHRIIEQVSEVADQAGRLGIEICDISGHVEEVATRVRRTIA